MRIDEVTDRDKYYYGDLLARIPQEPQRQDSTNDQLRDLVQVAQKLGMHDASDYILSVVNKNKEVDEANGTLPARGDSDPYVDVEDRKHGVAEWETWSGMGG